MPQYQQYEQLQGIAGLAFDVVWAMALGLNDTAQRIARNDDSGCKHLSGDLLPLEDFDYTNERLGCLMQQSMRHLNFTGLTVSYEYSQHKFTLKPGIH